jgi:hypothetical protein
MLVKGFLNDAKNAPEGIRLLNADIEILGVEAQNMSKLFRKAVFYICFCALPEKRQEKTYWSAAKFVWLFF